MSDDYIQYNTSIDLEPAIKRQEPNNLCVYNTDCHPDSSCVDNKCTRSMNLPKTMPNSVNYKSFRAEYKTNKGRKNYKSCLSNNDCNSKFCNSNFVCTNKYPNYSSYPNTRCTGNRDCPNGTCNNHYHCE
jgi:hypothetical protein